MKMLALAFVILLGANAYAVKSYRKARDNEKRFDKLDFFHSIIGGVFSGLVFFLITGAYLENEAIVVASSGIGAVMGFEGVTKLGDALISMVTDAAEKRIKK